MAKKLKPRPRPRAEPVDGPVPLEWLTPFSPTILRTRLPARILAAAAKATGRLLADKALCRQHAETSPVLANLTQRVGLPFDIAEKTGLVEFVHGACTAYFRRVAADVNPGVDLSRARADVVAAWVTRERPADFVPVHNYTGAISGVVFLKVPGRTAADCEEAGTIQFFDGRPADPLFTRHKVRFEPRAGDVYVFPSWLQNAAYPFRSAGERLAMHFNAALFEPPPEPPAPRTAARGKR